ncbi:MAG: GNAT family N-acetyltransferase [Acidobacteriota bacterium]|nr:GNAT family N-acetyltransferase [Acidobacteriota bacterium]
MKLLPLSCSMSPGTFVSEFCAMPGRIRREQDRVGMLPAGICRRLLEAPSPLVRESWLCYANARAVARVVANVCATRPDIGYFGLFEAALDGTFAAASDQLLSAARGWLRERGVGRVIGPVTYNTWFPYRFRLADGDERRFEWEPVNPPDYVRAVEEAGFELLERYASTAFGALGDVAEQLRPAYQEARAAGYTFLPITRGGLAASVRELHRLGHLAFADNLLFEPIPEALFADAYVGIADKGRPVLAWFVVDAAGEAVGFLYAFIDRWHGGRRPETCLVLKSVGIVPAARGQGLSNALVHLAITEGLRRGVDYAISALVRAGIHSESYARRGRFLWQHAYGLWESSVSATAGRAPAGSARRRNRQPR